MLRCSTCKESRWVYIRFGTLADDLERLTGWIPYGCQACGRAGWHHSRSIPPAFVELLQVVRSALARVLPSWPTGKAWIPRVPIARINGRLLTAAGGLVSAFALGLWVGALLFSGPTIGAGRESVAAATDVAPEPISPAVADAAPADSEPARDTRLAAAPAGADSLPPATTAAEVPVEPPAGNPRAAAPLETDAPAAVAAIAGGAAPVTPPVAAARETVTPAVDPAVTAAGDDERIRSRRPAPKPVTRTAALGRRQPQRTTATVKTVPRAPAAGTRKSPVRTGVAASSAPALPRFHGTLAIRSEPHGALVSVDGQVVGPTPVLLKGVRAGSRVVRIESEGYQRWSSAARVVANQQTAIVATLQRN